MSAWRYHWRPIQCCLRLAPSIDFAMDHVTDTYPTSHLSMPRNKQVIGISRPLRSCALANYVSVTGERRWLNVHLTVQGHLFFTYRKLKTHRLYDFLIFIRLMINSDLPHSSGSQRTPYPSLSLAQGIPEFRRQKVEALSIWVTFSACMCS